MKLSPSNIQIIGQELAIAWNDGEETYLPLEKLRRACPCATCSGEPDAMGRVAVIAMDGKVAGGVIRPFHRFARARRRMC